jgi:hypothetical protein
MATYLEISDDTEIIVSAPDFDELLPFIRYAHAKGVTVTTGATADDQPAIWMNVPAFPRPGEVIQFLMAMWSLHTPDQYKHSMDALPALVEQELEQFRS